MALFFSGKKRHHRIRKQGFRQCIIPSTTAMWWVNVSARLLTSLQKQIVSLCARPCHNEISRNNLPRNTHVAVCALAFGDVLAFDSSIRMTKSTRSWPTRNFDSCGFVILQRNHELFNEIPLSNLLRMFMETNL